MDKNHTKAFHYFLSATEKDEDADSWYNAGYCLQNGLGTEVDLPRAASFYKKAVTKYGHFGSAYLLGLMHYDGKGVSRSVPDALYYLNSINALGPWAGWVRRGLDAYLERNVAHSILCYLHGAELGGFEVAHSNAAFLLMKNFRSPRQSFLDVLRSTTYSTLQEKTIRALGFAKSGSNESVLSNNSMFMLECEVNNSSSPKNISNMRQILSSLYHPSALLRQLLLAVKLGNNDALRSTGDVFYNGQYLPFDRKPGSNHSILWYSRASARGSAVSSFNLGYMHQFGVGSAHKDIERAENYYMDAIGKSDGDEINSTPVRMLAQAMCWWMQAYKRYPCLRPLNGVLEAVVKTFDYI